MPNNFKVFRLNQRSIMNLLTRGEQLPDVVEIACCRGIPEGAKFHHLQLGYGGLAIEVLVEHVSFPDLPDGTPLVCDEFNLVYKRYRIYKHDKMYLLPDDRDELLDLLETVKHRLMELEGTTDDSNS